MTPRERIDELCHELRISRSRLEKEIGMSSGSLSHIEDNISKNVLTKIAERYPQINIEWLKNEDGTLYEKADKPLAELPMCKSDAMVNAVLSEIEEQREIIARFQKQIQSAQEQIEKCQNHITILLTSLKE